MCSQAQIIQLETEVYCLCTLLTGNCNTNSICQVDKADKNSNDCLELALRLVCQYSL